MYIDSMLSRYSHSSLGTYNSCPRMFKFRYIQKVTIPKVLPAHIYLGNVVHHLLKKVYDIAAVGKLLPQDELVKDYTAEWQKPIISQISVTSEHMAVDDYIEIGRKMLIDYYEEYQPFDQGTHLGSELNISFPLPGTNFGFRAVIDRLWRREDGVVEICDYKTGKLPAQGVNDETFRRQMGLYQLAVQSNFPDFESIELAQYFLKHGVRISCRLRPDELEELVEKFRLEISESIDAERRDDFPTKESGLCPYCDYLSLCPAKRHSAYLDGEIAADNDVQVSMEQASKLADRYIEINEQYNQARQKREALKEDIASVAEELGLERLAGSEADIKVRVVDEEKLITKTEDPRKFADLSHLVRQWDVDECFKLDNSFVMKQLLQKGKLSPEQQQKLGEYINSRRSSTVRVVKKSKSESD